MIDNALLQFEVKVLEVVAPPVANANGLLGQEVHLEIRQAGRTDTSEVSRDSVSGDALARCLELKSKGGITVYIPAGSLSDVIDWRQKVVDVALDSAINEGA